MTAARHTLLAAVGVAGVAVGVGAVVGLAPASVVGAASAVDATLATGLIGAGLVGYALRRRRSTQSPTARPLVDVNSASEPGDPGQPVDDALREIGDRAGAGRTRNARSGVRARVRTTAVRAYASRRTVTEEEAADAVAAGEWTADRVAAAFVGNERAPDYPLRERLRGWVQPDRAFQRRAARAADAVHALATDSQSMPTTTTTDREWSQ